MPSSRYNIEYEGHSENVLSGFGQLLQLQSLVDMTLMCDSHKLRVHKVVLAASSAHFQEVLQDVNDDPLIIIKTSFSILKSLVEFMYLGKTSCGEENLEEFIAAARFLKIKGLTMLTKAGLNGITEDDLPEFPPPIVIGGKYDNENLADEEEIIMLLEE